MLPGSQARHTGSKEPFFLWHAVEEMPQAHVPLARPRDSFWVPTLKHFSSPAWALLPQFPATNKARALSVSRLPGGWAR